MRGRTSPRSRLAAHSPPYRSLSAQRVPGEYVRPLATSKERTEASRSAGPTGPELERRNWSARLRRFGYAKQTTANRY